MMNLESIPTTGAGPLKQKIQRLFISDCAAIAISMVAIWAMVIFAMTAVRVIAPSRMVEALIVSSALLICLFATASLAAVFVHVRRNREAIYTEDILASIGQE